MQRIITISPPVISCELELKTFLGAYCLEIILITVNLIDFFSLYLLLNLSLFLRAIAAGLAKECLCLTSRFLLPFLDENTYLFTLFQPISQCGISLPIVYHRPSRRTAWPWGYPGRWTIRLPLPSPCAIWTSCLPSCFYLPTLLAPVRGLEEYFYCWTNLTFLAIKLTSWQMLSKFMTFGIQQ